VKKEAREEGQAITPRPLYLGSAAALSLCLNSEAEIGTSTHIVDPNRLSSACFLVSGEEASAIHLRPPRLLVAW
jgi:hypothetical protein